MQLQHHTWQVLPKSLMKCPHQSILLGERERERERERSSNVFIVLNSSETGEELRRLPLGHLVARV